MKNSLFTFSMCLLGLSLASSGSIWGAESDSGTTQPLSEAIKMDTAPLYEKQAVEKVSPQLLKEEGPTGVLPSKSGTLQDTTISISPSVKEATFSEADAASFKK